MLTTNVTTVYKLHTTHLSAQLINITPCSHCLFSSVNFTPKFTRSSFQRRKTPTAARLTDESIVQEKPEVQGLFLEAFGDGAQVAKLE